MRALLSVANRDGITILARDLRSLDVEVFATDGCAMVTNVDVRGFALTPPCAPD